jgi:hypothetical protein
MAKKQGWEKGLGKFAKDGPKNGPRVTNTRVPTPESITDASRRPGEDWSDQIYNEHYPIRGVRKGFS